MIKLVACALDGTLLAENHQLSQRNIQAIHGPVSYTHLDVYKRQHVYYNGG